MTTIIESLGVYLPENAVSTDDLLRGCANEVRFPLEQLTGVVSRRMAGETEFSIDLSKRAIADCFAHSDHTPADIDLLVACNISRFDASGQVSYEPGTALKLKRHFGFDNALVFDIANACAGMFTGLFVVDALIRAGIIRRGMVFSGEYITHLSRTAQKEIDRYMDPRLACLTVGDAGAAVILEESPDSTLGFLGIDIFTLAKYSSVCVAKPSDHTDGGATMLTDPMQAAALGLEPAALHAASLLRQSQLPLEAFQHVVPHQISTISINEGMSEIGKLFDVDIEKHVINNLAQRGNTASNTHFVALKDHILNHRIQSGDGAIFCIAGSGISVGTALYKFDDLPDRLRRSSPDQACVSHTTAKSGKGSVTFDLPRSARVQVESIGLAYPGEGDAVAETRELESRAARICLENSAYESRDIELLLSAGVYRTGFVAEPAAAAMVADDLEINHDHDPHDPRRTFAFDILNGSAGFLSACHVAAGMISAGRFNNAMVVAAESQNASANQQQPGPAIRQLGSALVVNQSSDGRKGFSRFLFRYFTEYIDSYTAHAIQRNGRTFLETSTSRHWENYLFNGIQETVEELLDLEGLRLSDITVILPPQMPQPFVARLAAVLRVTQSKVVDVTHPHEDYFTSSLPVALDAARRQALVSDGDLGLIISAGAGIQVGCALYCF